MGVWIETLLHSGNQLQMVVTPCMGVWIETVAVNWCNNALMSHPVWVCGLKQYRKCNNIC